MRFVRLGALTFYISVDEIKILEHMKKMKMQSQNGEPQDRTKDQKPMKVSPTLQTIDKYLFVLIIYEYVPLQMSYLTYFSSFFEELSCFIPHLWMISYFFRKIFFYLKCMLNGGPEIQ